MRNAQDIGWLDGFNGVAPTSMDDLYLMGHMAGSETPQ